MAVYEKTWSYFMVINDRPLAALAFGAADAFALGLEAINTSPAVGC